jgi:hypothetical protein
MELNILYVSVHSKIIFRKHNYELCHNFDKITKHTLKYSTLHETIHNAAVTTLLFLAGVGVKRRADRRGSTAHVTASVLSELEKPVLEPRF